MQPISVMVKKDQTFNNLNTRRSWKTLHAKINNHDGLSDFIKNVEKKYPPDIIHRLFQHHTTRIPDKAVFVMNKYYKQ